MPSAVEELAQILPSDARVALIKVILDSSGGSIQVAAREIGISRMQLYRYSSATGRRPTPSVSTGSKILKAAMRVDPATTRLYLRTLAGTVTRLVESL